MSLQPFLMIKRCLESSKQLVSCNLCHSKFNRYKADTLNNDFMKHFGFILVLSRLKNHFPLANQHFRCLESPRQLFPCKLCHRKFWWKEKNCFSWWFLCITFGSFMSYHIFASIFHWSIMIVGVLRVKKKLISCKLCHRSLIDWFDCC